MVSVVGVKREQLLRGRFFYPRNAVAIGVTHTGGGGKVAVGRTRGLATTVAQVQKCVWWA